MRKAIGLLPLVLLLAVVPVLGDGAAPQPKSFRVEGAKIVSEGAYFYFEITSTSTATFNMTMTFPLRFEFEDAQMVLLRGNRAIFSLPARETVQFHFHAPWIGEGYEHFAFTFMTNPQEALTFTVTVVSLTLLKNLKEVESLRQELDRERASSLSAFVKIMCVGIVTMIFALYVYKKREPKIF